MGFLRIPRVHRSDCLRTASDLNWSVGLQTLSVLSTREDWLQVKVKVILRPRVSRPVCLGMKHLTGAYNQIFVTVRELRVCSCGALSLTSGRVCRLQLLLALASGVILGYESCGTLDHILLSQIRDFPFRCLPRLAGLRWRYSTPPPHGIRTGLCVGSSDKASARIEQKTAFLC
jgi:hypothetical protein